MAACNRPGFLPGLRRRNLFYNAYAAVAQKSPNAASAIAAVDRSWQANPVYQFLKFAICAAPSVTTRLPSFC